MIPVRRLNHAVLYVRDIDQAVDFYTTAFSFEVMGRIPQAHAAFLRAAGSDNDHDLGLFGIGDDAPGPQAGRVGLYHLAWQVERIDDLVTSLATLQKMGALVGASDHGTTKSLYGKDPDGNEFEVMWIVPQEHWDEIETRAAILPLDLDAEVARWSGIATTAH